jgi:phospholipase/lecithinase/hemolysin
VYRFDGTGFTPNPVAGCTSFAVGGARINNALQSGGQQSPQALLRQLQDMKAKGLTGTDLVLVDGGGNDAADLASAFLLSPTNLGSELRQLVKSLLSDAEIEAALRDDGLEGLGEAYMERLADTLFGQIDAHILSASEARVAVLNMPDVTKTPRFTSALARIEDLLGANVRRDVEEHVRDWVSDFNEQLAKRANGQSRVTVADFEDRLDTMIDNPARFGLTNVTTPACEPGFDDTDGKPVELDFEHCTAQALSALTPPTSVPGGSNWWTSYLFADSFHPTPYGHQLMADLVQDSLQRKGWAP